MTSEDLDIESAHVQHNPFADPNNVPHYSSATEEDVLTVDRNATLTLGTETLILLDEGLRHSTRISARNCCGLSLPSIHLPNYKLRHAKTTRAIPFYNVLSATFEDFEVVVKYALPTSRRACVVGCISYPMTDKSLHGHAIRWVARLTDRAYPANTTRKPRMKVLINPFGGQGYAQNIWTGQAEPLFAAAGCVADVERTGYRGHAVEIAQTLDIEAYDVVVCASGDGLPHEVFNGLAKQSDPRRALRKVAVVQLPCGSGNAMSLNLNGTDSPSLAALAILKGVRTAMDLVAITQGEKLYYSFLSQAVGILAESDLGTESLRWMGSFRFTWGVLVRLMGKKVYPADLEVVLESDDKSTIRNNHRCAVETHERHPPTCPPPTTTLDSLLDNSAPPEPFPSLQYGIISTTPPAQTFRSLPLPTLGNFYAGNMCYMAPSTPLFPASLPSDGLLDMITISALTPRHTSLRMLATIGNGRVMEFEDVVYRKAAAYRIYPRIAEPKPRRAGHLGLRGKTGRWLGGRAEGTGREREGLIAIDGERVPFEPFQAEVLGGVGTVLSLRGGVYETRELKSW